MHPELTTALGILVAALLADRLLGEYPHALHPVVWMGKAISLALKLAPRRGRWGPFIFGVTLTVSLTGLSAGLAYLVVALVAGRSWLDVLVGTYLLKAAFALRALDDAVERVQFPLQRGDVAAAREAVRSLCSRDPSALAPEALLEATVESLAENASDSFVAPLFYYVILGIPGAVGYRAINTLDAMIGYHGEYEWLGKAAARLDDAVNWLPARITAGLFLLAGWISGLQVANGWRVLRRDGGTTPSPNGGRPMAVMAGLLNVRLTKPGVYALGDAHEPLTTSTVDAARQVVRCAAIIMTALVALALVGISRAW